MGLARQLRYCTASGGLGSEAVATSSGREPTISPLVQSCYAAIGVDKVRRGRATLRRNQVAQGRPVYA